MTVSAVAIEATPRPRGYAAQGYAATLSHIGAPVHLPRADVDVLRRAVDGAPETDLVGPYPLLPVADPAALVADLDDLPDLGCTAVTDPLTPVDDPSLRAHVRGVVRAWKLHHVLDFRHDDDRSGHHVRNVRRASVDVALEPGGAADVREAWIRLYASLRARHGFTGHADLPPQALGDQLGLDGMRVYVARAEGQVCAIVTVVFDGANAWYHLGASDERGRERRATFALFDHVIRDLRALGCLRLDLGAGAGLVPGTDGLTRFKSGWTNTTAPTWLLHHVIDAEGQARAIARSGRHDFLPPYRSGA